MEGGGGSMTKLRAHRKRIEKCEDEEDLSVGGEGREGKECRVFFAGRYGSDIRIVFYSSCKFAILLTKKSEEREDGVRAPPLYVL